MHTGEEGEVQAIFSHPTSKAARRLVYPAGAPQAESLPGHKLVRVAFGGTQTTDTYSLRGSSQALDAINKACNVSN